MIHLDPIPFLPLLSHGSSTWSEVETIWKRLQYVLQVVIWTKVHLPEINTGYISKHDPFMSWSGHIMAW